MKVFWAQRAPFSQKNEFFLAAATLPALLPPFWALAGPHRLALGSLGAGFSDLGPGLFHLGLPGLSVLGPGLFDLGPCLFGLGPGLSGLGPGLSGLVPDHSWKCFNKARFKKRLWLLDSEWPDEL